MPTPLRQVLPAPTATKLQPISQRRVVFSQAIEPASRRIELQNTGCISVSQEVQRKPRTFDQAGSVPETLVLNIQRLPFLRRKTQSFKLTNLPLELLALCQRFRTTGSRIKQNLRFATGARPRKPLQEEDQAAHENPASRAVPHPATRTGERAGHEYRPAILQLRAIAEP